jgi:hypothetical protein
MSHLSHGIGIEKCTFVWEFCLMYTCFKNKTKYFCRSRVNPDSYREEMELSRCRDDSDSYRKKQSGGKRPIFFNYLDF